MGSKRQRRSKAKKYGNPAKRAAVLAAERGQDGPPGEAQLGALPDRTTTALDSIQKLLGGSSRERTAGWFADAQESIRSGSAALVGLDGPRAVMVATAELLGGVYHHVLHEVGRDMFFEEFSAELIERTAADLQDGVGDPERLARLLYGLCAMALPDDAEEIWARYLAAVGASRSFPAAPWLLSKPELRATGRLWRAMDEIGGARRVVFAELEWARDTFVYAWDIDVCDHPLPLNAGVFDDVEQAHAAWQAWVGPVARDARPERVDDVPWGHLYRESFMGLRGDETRSLMDNWHLTQRAAQLVGSRLGTSPEDERADWRDALVDFVAWCEAERGRPLTADERDVTEAFVEYWCDLIPRDTWGVISPHRIVWNRGAITDWFDDEWYPKVLTVLPDWIRYQGHRTGATEAHVERALTFAHGEGRREAQDCPGADFGSASDDAPEAAPVRA
ncbi:hypothetical protein GCM10028784_23400 [Myceligenerans cantabricum]